jgi:hypothetical protein
MALAEVARWWRQERRSMLDAPSSNATSVSLLCVVSSVKGREFVGQRIAYYQSKLLQDPTCARTSLLLGSFRELAGDYSRALCHYHAALVQNEANMKKAPRTNGERILSCRQLRKAKTRAAFHLTIQERQKRLRRKLPHRPDGSIDEVKLREPVPQAVQQRAAGSLSYEAFIDKFASRGVPVVIKGGACEATTGHGTLSLDTLRVLLRDKKARVKQVAQQSLKWARLEDAGEVAVEELISAILDQKDQSTELGSQARSQAGQRRSNSAQDAACESSFRGLDVSGLYLHDWSIPQHCPELLPLLQIPSYFAADFLHRIPLQKDTARGGDTVTGKKAGAETHPHQYQHDDAGTLTGTGSDTETGTAHLYSTSWPSLFIGPQGTSSATHIDAFGSHFWMALFEGKKRWVLFPQRPAQAEIDGVHTVVEEDQLPYLYPYQMCGADDSMLFNIDVGRGSESRRSSGSSGSRGAVDLHKHPLYSLASPVECVLEAGDLIFVPSGCPHFVENLSHTVAISCNYVDATNLARVREALSVEAGLPTELMAEPAPVDAGVEAGEEADTRGSMARVRALLAALPSATVDPLAMLCRTQPPLGCTVDSEWATRVWPRKGEKCDWVPSIPDAVCSGNFGAFAAAAAGAATGGDGGGAAAADCQHGPPKRKWEAPQKPTEGVKEAKEGELKRRLLAEALF